MAIGIAGIHFDLFAAFSGGLGSKSVEKALQSKAEAALNASGSSWANIDMRGQKAVLSGDAPDDAARQNIVKLVRASTGRGGLVFGGVTRVNADALKIKPIVEIYFWQAEKSKDGRLELSGHVGSETARQALLAQAGSATNLIDALHIEANIAAKWDAHTQTLLSALERLDEGIVRQKDQEWFLDGRTTDPNVKADLETQFAQLPPPLQGTINITLDAAPTETDPTAPINNVDQCQQLFDAALSENTVLFATSSAQIDAQSFLLLDAIAQTALRCSNFTLTIAGHTDQLGDPAFNDHLSELRAQSVSTYLITNGVPASLIRSRGAGSRELLCNNNTRACRKQNRRIEITVE